MDGYNSFQRFTSSTQKNLETLVLLLVPAGMWTNISYDLIANLSKYRLGDSILIVVDFLKKMVNFLPCRKSMNLGQLADLMVEHAWKLHGTSNNIVSDHGSFCISQITPKLDWASISFPQQLTTQGELGSPKFPTKWWSNIPAIFCATERKSGPPYFQWWNFLTKKTTRQQESPHSWQITDSTRHTAEFCPQNSLFPQCQTNSAN